MYHNRLVADVNVIRKEKQQRSSICMFIYFISHEHFITTCGCCITKKLSQRGLQNVTYIHEQCYGFSYFI